MDKSCPYLRQCGPPKIISFTYLPGHSLPTIVTDSKMSYVCIFTDGPCEVRDYNLCPTRINYITKLLEKKVQKHRI